MATSEHNSDDVREDFRQRPMVRRADRDTNAERHGHFTVWEHPDGWSWFCECGNGNSDCITLVEAFDEAKNHALNDGTGA